MASVRADGRRVAGARAVPPPEVAGHVRALRPYVPGKPIEEVEREYGIRDIVKLASNESPLGPSPLALAAIRDAAASLRLYPDGACYALTRALARHWDVTPENLILGNGSDEVIHMLALTYLRPGDEVLSCEPTFVQYRTAATLGEAEYVAPSLRDYAYDIDAMIERLSERTRLVFIANPNNPTGTMLSRPEIERLLERLPERAILVLDEAYYEYVDDPAYPRSLDYVAERLNVVVLRTFSKIYALAGLRVGYGIARPEIIASLQKVREPFNVNSLAQVGALASLADPEQVKRSREVNAAGMRYLTERLTALGAECVPSHANFLLVDLRRDCREVFEALLRRGVIVRTGDIFGLPTHVRISIGVAAENERLIAALTEALPASPAA